MTNIIDKIKDNRTGLTTKEELMERLQDGSIDTVVLAFCDMQGRLMGKRLTADYCLENEIDKGSHFCKYLLGTDFEMDTPEGYHFMNWEDGYGDWLAKPDWSTLRVVPWLEKTAIVFTDVLDDHGKEQIPISPRNLLKQQLANAEKLGYRPFMASELEFYLFRDTFEEVHQKNYEGLLPAGHYNEDYNLLQGTRNEPFYQKVRQYMRKVGVPIESSKGEAHIGQHEINMKFARALKAADNHMMFKHGMKEISIQEGHAITFMAKPHHEWTGSSGHIHLSLWDLAEEKNLFFDQDEQGNDYHMSSVMRHFLAGVLAYTRDFALFFAPHVNSYKRFAFESWAPVNIAWSCDNRTSGYRIVGSGQSLRMETRIPGADMNPYLAYTALIGSGLYGIEQKLGLNEEYKGNAYKGAAVPKIPSSLYEAISCWENSEVVKHVLGDKIAAHYLHAAKVEQQKYNLFVTEWERERYFEQG